MNSNIDYSAIMNAVRLEGAQCVHNLTTLAVHISRLDGQDDASNLVSFAARDIADICMGLIDQFNEMLQKGAGAKPQC